MDYGHVNSPESFCDKIEMVQYNAAFTIKKWTSRDRSYEHLKLEDLDTCRLLEGYVYSWKSARASLLTLRELISLRIKKVSFSAKISSCKFHIKLWI